MPMKACDLMSKQPVTQLLVYGAPGTGKTSFSASSPMPFIVLTEPQGLGSIYVRNRNAIIEPIKDYRHFCTIMRALKRGARVRLDNGQPAFKFQYPLDEDLDYVQAALGCGDSQDPQEYVIQTLVVDSLTDIHNKIAAYYPSDEEDQEVNFYKVQRDFAHILDDLRSLPVNLICIALEDRVLSKKKVLLGIQPMLFGKMAIKAGQYFAGVGYAGKRTRVDDDGAASVVYGIVWSSAGNIQTKAPPCMGQLFPEYTINSLDTPGRTTLGSMLRAMYPDQQVAHCAQDSADHVWI